MRRTLTIFLVLIFSALLPLQGQIPATSDASKLSIQDDGKREFYELETDINELRRELDELRDEIQRYRNKVNMPLIREEIKRSVKAPEMNYRVLLKNGTVIEGDITDENMDRVLFQTQIGELTLDRKLIEKISRIERSEPKLAIKGPVDEQTFSDKKIYSGRIENTGDKRADFVRIIFSLFDEETKLINADSSFVVGHEVKFESGIYSSSSIETGENALFKCEVNSNNVPVSYYTTEIVYERFE